MQLLASVLLLGIASTLSPGILAITLSLLSSRRYPMQNALSFLAGMLPTVLIIALACAGSTEFALKYERDPNVLSKIDFFLGALFMLFALLPWVLKGRQDAKLPKQEGTSRAHRGRWFLLGFILTITNFDAVLFYATAIKEISASATAFAYQLLLASAGALFFLLPALLPIALFAFLPKKAEKILSPIRSFMEKYGQILVSAVFLGFGIYFLLRSQALLQ